MSRLLRTSETMNSDLSNVDVSAFRQLLKDTGVSAGSTLPTTTNKGDILASDAITFAKLSASTTNGQILTVDTTQTLGIKWSTPAGVGEVNTISSSTSGGNSLLPTPSKVSSDLKTKGLKAGNGISISSDATDLTVSSTVVGGLVFVGTWNAATNTPALFSGVGVQNYYVVVSVAGTTNLDGITDWQVGDWALFNGTVYQKLDHSDTNIINDSTPSVSTVYSSTKTDTLLLNVNGSSVGMLNGTLANMAGSTSKFAVWNDGVSPSTNYVYFPYNVTVFAYTVAYLHSSIPLGLLNSNTLTFRLRTIASGVARSTTNSVVYTPSNTVWTSAQNGLYLTTSWTDQITPLTVPTGVGIAFHCAALSALTTDYTATDFDISVSVLFQISNTFTPSPVFQLSDATDCVLNAPANNEIIQYETATNQWKNKPLTLTTNLDSLTDVGIVSQTANNILMTDTSNTSWVNKSVTSTGIITVGHTDSTLTIGNTALSLNSLNNVATSGLTDNDILAYNSGNSRFENRTRYTLTPSGTGNGLIASTTAFSNVLKGLSSGGTISLTANANDILISSTGEANTASNVGTGIGVFKQKTGTDLELKSLTTGSSHEATLTSNTNDVAIRVPRLDTVNVVKLNATWTIEDIGGVFSLFKNDVLIASFNDSGVLNFSTNTGGLRLPNGETANRVNSPGNIRFNTTISRVECYDGTAWIPIRDISILDNLTDVDITTPTEGQSLVYTSGSWKNVVSGPGSGTVLQRPGSPASGQQYFNTTYGIYEYYNNGWYTDARIFPNLDVTTYLPSTVNMIPQVSTLQQAITNGRSPTLCRESRETSRNFLISQSIMDNAYPTSRFDNLNGSNMVVGGGYTGISPTQDFGLYFGRLIANMFWDTPQTFRGCAFFNPEPGHAYLGYNIQEFIIFGNNKTRFTNMDTELGDYTLGGTLLASGFNPLHNIPQPPLSSTNKPSSCWLFKTPATYSSMHIVVYKLHRVSSNTITPTIIFF